MGENKVVGSEVKSADDLFTTSRQGHILNLISNKSASHFVLLPLFLFLFLPCLGL